MTRWISGLALLVALTGCAEAENGEPDTTPNSAAQTETTIDGSDEDAKRALEAELIETDREFARTVADHGLSGWVAGFAPSGRMVEGGESYIGREGIRRTMLPLFADTTSSFTWDPNYAEVAVSGDVGYTVGRYEISAEGDAASMSETGTYLKVWTRTDDGAWKVKAEIGNPDAPDGARR